MGGATAYHLAKRGQRVIGIDQHAPPHAHGSSHGRSRMIREAYYEHPLYVPLVQRAYALWGELERAAGDRTFFITTGGLMVGSESGPLVSGTLRSTEELAKGWQSLSPEDQAMVRGAFEYQGQKCSAASRAFVPKSVWQRMGDDFLDATGKLTYGDVTDLSNYGGAVIDQRAFAKNAKAIDRARGAEAVTVAVGGEYDDSEGYFIRPTVLLSDDPTDEAFRDEYFGPILPIVTVDSVDAAIDFINARPCPLALYHFDHDRGRTERVLELVEGPHDRALGDVLRVVLVHVSADEPEHEGQVALRESLSGRAIAGAREHRAGMYDAFLADHQVAIGEGQTAADLMHVDMRLDPVADAGRAGEVRLHARRGEQGRWSLAARRAIAQGDVAKSHQQAAMGDAARIGVLGLDAQPDHERAVAVLAIEERPVVIEERAGAEQRLEALGRIAVHAGTLLLMRRDRPRRHGAARC
mgnify:CR=1 FL=1